VLSETGAPASWVKRFVSDMAGSLRVGGGEVRPK
jgi:hypothetical protein